MIIWDIHTAQSFQNNRNKYALSAFNRDISLDIHHIITHM